MNAPYDFVVFDCDGVILQSNALKSRAFADALSGDPQVLIDQFVAYHQANGGVSRYRKFEHYFTSIRKLHPYDDRLKWTLVDYADRVKRGLIACLTVPGVVDFLTHLNSRRIRCAVNSGGDQAELRDVFESRRLSQHFTHILGSPTSKVDNMRFLREAGFMHGQGVMFGDSRSDFEAAQAFDLDFVFVGYESEWKDAHDVLRLHEAKSIADFHAIEIHEW